MTVSNKLCKQLNDYEALIKQNEVRDVDYEPLYKEFCKLRSRTGTMKDRVEHIGLLNEEADEFLNLAQSKKAENLAQVSSEKLFSDGLDSGMELFA